jgi:hypothetical protein
VKTTFFGRDPGRRLQGYAGARLTRSGFFLTLARREKGPFLKYFDPGALPFLAINQPLT